MKLGFLRRNIGYKALSLALAVLLYAVVWAQRRPITMKEVYIQPEVTGLPPDMALKSAPEGFRVTVSGDAAAVEQFRTQSTKAILNLSEATTGTSTVDINYNTQGLDIEIIGKQRTQVTLEKSRKLSYGVDVLHDNSPPPGFAYQEPVVDPAKVTISGLSSDVSKVARVVAIVNIPENGGAFSGTVDVIPQNINYEAVDAVSVDPPKVMVTIPLKKAPITKTMVLAASIIGTPASGHALFSYTFIPPLVTVAGSESQITGTSTLYVPVDITGMQTTVTRTVKVALPRGMTMIDPRSGDVKLRLEFRSIAPVASPPTPEPTPIPKLPTPRPATEPREPRPAASASPGQSPSSEKE